MRVVSRLGSSLNDEQQQLLGLSSPAKPATKVERSSSQMSSKLQFAVPICYVEEGEGAVEIWVQRLGSLRDAASVRYRTEDGSATAGWKFEYTEGVLEFAEGVPHTSFIVPIMDDEDWAATVEFRVHLEDPDNCALCEHLHTCRVKIIDDDLFPSNKYQQVADGHEAILDINAPSLFVEFLKLIFDLPGFGWKTVLTCVLDQLHNAYLLFTLWAQTYLVDVVFAPDTSPDKRTTTAFLVAMGYMVPMIVLFAWDRTKINLCLKDQVRTFLQASLFRKYLNYTEHARNLMPTHLMQQAVIDDARSLADGYDSVIFMMTLIGKVCVLLGFVLHTDISGAGLIVVVLLPTLMMCFCSCRGQILLDADRKLDDRLAAVSGVVSEVCHKYGLIADYKQRPQMNDHFRAVLGTLEDAHLSMELVNSINEAFPRWLGAFSVGLYVIFMSPSVGMEDAVSLGGFLATIRVLLAISEDFEELYIQMIKCTKTIGPLRDLTFAFNLPTDVRDWRDLGRKHELYTREWREEKLASGSERDADPHLMDIRVSGLNFHYQGQDPLFEDVNISVEQGCVVALMGDHATGKATFLRLLGQSQLLHPDYEGQNGDFFVPSHLRVLHVSREAIILDLSPWKNLTFGVPKGGEPEAHQHRVLGVLSALRMLRTRKLVLKELGLKEELGHTNGGASCADFAHGLEDEEYLEEEDSELEECRPLSNLNCRDREPEDGPDVRDALSKDNWKEQLTYTEIVKMHIARAFVANPEVMILQRPLHHFNPNDSKGVLECICSYARQTMSGFEHQGGGSPERRSVFYSAEHDDHAKLADVVWQIEGRKVFRKTRPG